MLLFLESSLGAEQEDLLAWHKSFVLKVLDYIFQSEQVYLLSACTSLTLWKSTKELKPDKDLAFTWEVVETVRQNKVRRIFVITGMMLIFCRK